MARLIPRGLAARLALSVLAGVALACNTEIDPVPIEAIKPFDSLDQARVEYELKLFGGDGQWDIRLTGVVHNTTGVARIFNTRNVCPLVLQAFTNPAGTGTPAWDQRAASLGCKSMPVVDTIAPGDSLVIVGTHTTTNEILAHYGQPPANPPGQYFFYSVLPTELAASGEDRRLVGFIELR